MALTLPASFNNHSNKRNWLFQLHYDNESNFTGVAFYDTVVESVQYHGSVLNKPSIRESINLTRSTSKTSNVSINIANFKYLADDFSAEIFGGSRDYINRTVKVYIQPEDATGISDCLLIYSGKLSNISHDIDKIKLSIEAKKPWDGVEIPQVKTDKNNYYPIAYGDFTANSSSVASTPSDDDDFRNRKTLYPIPVEERRGDTLFALTGIRSTTNNCWPHYYEKSIDKFIPLANDASTYNTVDSQNESYGDGYAIRFHQNMLRKIVFKPSERTSSGTGWQSNDNAFNGTIADTSNYTEFNYDGDFLNNEIRTISFKLPQIHGFPSLLVFHYTLTGTATLSNISGSGAGRDIQIKLIDNTFGSGVDLGHINLDANETITTLSSSPGNTDISSVATIKTQSDRDSAFLASSSGWGSSFDLQVKQTRNHSSIDGDLLIQFRLYDLRIETVSQLDFNNTTNGGTKADAYKFLDDLDYVYCGANGLKDNGWNSDSAITEIHEAHRDLLHRFTSYTNSNTPTNWSSGRNLNAAKDWRIRYWLNEPVSLIRALEKLQYEGGFIFRFNGQGAGEYIYIPDSVSADHTLNTDDLANVEISLSSMSQVITSMDIEYRKHPALNGHMSKVSATNSTAISDLKIGTNENKKTIRLDAYVGDTSSENDIPTASTSNVNDDWYSYYDNIIGSQKIIVSATVISPLFYGIDVGDFVNFNTMPVDPFGESWSGKNFIVISVTRQVDKLKCKFREI
tara:strand:+ start:10354 stop:12570 length:2217 start_codon:yes stop_codon:yes gene_type:complete